MLQRRRLNNETLDHGTSGNDRIENSHDTEVSSMVAWFPNLRDQGATERKKERKSTKAKIVAKKICFTFVVYNVVISSAHLL